MSLITIKEVLTLFDRVTGYGIDLYSRNRLSELKENAKGKHVTDRLTAVSIIENHIERRYKELNRKRPVTGAQRDSIIHVDADSTPVVYEKSDILSMLEHKIVQNTLAQQFRNNTKEVSGIFVPAVLAEEHPYHPANQPNEADNWEMNWL